MGHGYGEGRAADAFDAAQYLANYATCAPPSAPTRMRRHGTSSPTASSRAAPTTLWPQPTSSSDRPAVSLLLLVGQARNGIAPRGGRNEAVALGNVSSAGYNGTAGAGIVALLAGTVVRTDLAELRRSDFIL